MSPKTPPIQKRLGHFDQLVHEWKVIYLMLGSDPEWEWWVADQDFESLCVGWCLAKGLGIRDAHDFYQAMIPLKLS